MMHGSFFSFHAQACTVCADGATCCEDMNSWLGFVSTYTLRKLSGLPNFTAPPPLRCCRIAGSTCRRLLRARWARSSCS